MSEEIQPILVTLPVDLHRALKERAEAEDRSMNKQAIIAIRQHLKRKVKA